MRKLVLLLSIWLITGCAKSIGSFQVQVEEASVAESGSQSTQTPTDPVQDPVTPPPPSTPGNSQGLCGPLNFDGIQWTNALNTTEQKGLSLSLSVSGSFEGRSGWANITNNFDGMGLSLGLLQQNFGCSPCC